MPAAAVRDLFEWPFERTTQQELEYVLQKERPIAQIVSSDTNTPAMQDDRPINEYVILRTLKRNKFQVASLAAWYEHTKNP
jgi:hypothetical protein